MPVPRLSLVAASLGLALASGCASVQSSAVATGRLAGPPRSGPVAIYMAQPLPPGAREVGLVEARGTGDHDGVDELFPELVQCAQQLGANALVIEWVGPRFDAAYYPMSSQVYPCGWSTCLGMSMTGQTTEIMTVVMRGRAYLVPEATP